MGEPWSRCEVIGDCTLYLGDCMEILPTLPKVDACVTDPPYGVNLGKCGDPRGGSHGKRLDGYGDAFGEDTYERFVEDIVPRLNAAINISARAAVWSGPHIHEQAKPNAIGGVFCSAATGRTAWGFKNFLPLLLYGGSPTVMRGEGARYPTAIFSNAVPERNGHPVPKPIEWMTWTVCLASDQTDTILDPFMGSGTTGVACVKLGRKFIGIEIEPRYFDIACRRIEEAYRSPDLFIEHAKKERAQTVDLFEGDAA